MSKLDDITTSLNAIVEAVGDLGKDVQELADKLANATGGLTAAETEALANQAELIAAAARNAAAVYKHEGE